MKWLRQDYINLMTFQQVERQFFCELFGPLIGLEKEWMEQGATAIQMDLSWFCFDYMDTFTVGNTGAINCFQEQMLEETGDYIIKTDYLGRTVKMCKRTATIPLPLNFPVKDMESWYKIKHMFEYDNRRVDFERIERAADLQRKGALICANIPGGFDILRELMGEEVACISFYEQPELIEDILNTISDTNIKVLDSVSGKITIDQLGVHEDMAGKHAPLVGPNIVRQFIKPYYRKSWDLLNKRGTKLFSQDSDGNMNAVMDSFIESGVNIFYPCEPAAGMDIVQLRRKYGNKIAFKGGIDKHVLRGSKENIRKELEYKMQPEMQTGGVVFGLDHRIPNGTPLENYIYYVKTARELLNLPPIEQSEKGWGRMAF